MCGGSLFCIPFLSQHVFVRKQILTSVPCTRNLSLFYLFYGLKNALLHLSKLNHGSYSSGSSSPSSPSPSLLSMSTGPGLQTLLDCLTLLSSSYHHQGQSLRTPRFVSKLSFSPCLFAPRRLVICSTTSLFLCFPFLFPRTLCSISPDVSSTSRLL